MFRPAITTTTRALRCSTPLRTLSTRSFLHRPHRHLHTTTPRRNGPRKEPFVNILSDSDLPPPPVQVTRVDEGGIHLADGLVVNGGCVFLEGEVFLWDVAGAGEGEWKKEWFEVFEAVKPRPEILLLGTGKTLTNPSSASLKEVKDYLAGLGIQVDVLDTKNACSYYNLLAEEGRRVGAALMPFVGKGWTRATVR
ncbi:hypothetical protein VNI00_013425 [Paramarasmius palmivorus]|uniref:NADH dehydrogenase [ubiquinone] 1 alpha subcomplex assembly factor 3 n=1 Tax=Paramarasmius palmivorus TaxID=297713 RepID=A0AAW0BZZ7_9AGAR